MLTDPLWLAVLADNDAQNSVMVQRTAVSLLSFLPRRNDTVGVFFEGLPTAFAADVPRGTSPPPTPEGTPPPNLISAPGAGWVLLMKGWVGCLGSLGVRLFPERPGGESRRSPAPRPRAHAPATRPPTTRPHASRPRTTHPRARGIFAVFLVIFRGFSVFLHLFGGYF